MVKNLLLLKNELVSLEITSVGNSQQALTTAAGGMQHFSAIWDSTLSISSSAVTGFLSGLSSYIPWQRGPSPAPPPPGGAKQEQDATERLDDLLRQNIYAFTSRWGQSVFDAKKSQKTAGGTAGSRSLAKVERELEELLDRAFAGQPEVVGKLKEAVGASALALAEGKGDRKGRGR